MFDAARREISGEIYKKKKKIGNRPNCVEGRKQRNFLGHVSSEKRNIILIGERQVCLG
jgi:hypothetical protein